MKAKIFITCTLALLIITGCAGVYQKGDIFLLEGKYDSAIAEYKSIIEYDPLNYKAYIKLGDAYAAKSDFKFAHENYEYALQVRENDPVAVSKIQEAYMKEAGEYQNKGNSGDALFIYEKLKTLYPEYNKVNYTLGKLYKDIGSTEKAKQALTEALTGENSEDARMVLIELETSNEEAVKIFKEGMELYNSGYYYESVESFEKSLKLQPDNIEYKYMASLSKGRHLVKKGSVGSMWDAIKALGDANYIKPNEIEPVFYTALAYEKKDKKDYDNPIKFYEQASKLAPESELGKQSLVKAKELKETKIKMEKFLKKKKGGGK